MFKRLLILVVAFSLAFGAELVSADKKTKKDDAQKPAAENVSNVKFTSTLDSIAYAIGMQLGSNMKNDSLMINPQILASGMNDALYKNKTALTEEQVRELMNTLQQYINARKERIQNELSEKNLADGKKFLAENKVKAGVVTTPSGLQYQVIKEGAGNKPDTTDEVVCNYVGKLIDGTEFDNSYTRGEPITFPLNRIIKGWVEGLQLMREGAKYRFVIPPDLAYGEQAPPQIGPNAVLVFEVELVKISPKPDADKKFTKTAGSYEEAQQEANKSTEQAKPAKKVAPEPKK